MASVHQEALDFEAPSQPIGSPLSRHCSAMGAAKAGEVVARQMIRLLTAYKAGPLTDAEAATLTGIQRSSVIPRRRELMKRGLVVECGHKKNPDSGVSNTTYRLAGAE